jgi:hypothetical protein
LRDPDFPTNEIEIAFGNGMAWYLRMHFATTDDNIDKALGVLLQIEEVELRLSIVRKMKNHDSV